MPEHPNPLIVSAIEGKHVLSLVYDGRPTDFEPYTYGRLISGIDFLFGWQRTGLFPAWRVLWIHRAQSLRMTEQIFVVPRPGYENAVAGVAAVYSNIQGLPGSTVAKPPKP